MDIKVLRTFKARRLMPGLHVVPIIIRGPYLTGRRCKVIISSAGKIFDCNLVSCVWAGDDKFDAWFKVQYEPEFIKEAA